MTVRTDGALAGILKDIQRPGARPKPTRAATGKRGPGRPKGKRSDPKFKQITGLIERDLHRAVLIKMLNTGRPHDLGPILSELLGAWVKQK